MTKGSSRVAVGFTRFPAKQISTDPESGIRRRHHLHGTVYNEAIKRAAQAAAGRVKGFASRD